jgi:hypothetical protein
MLFSKGTDTDVALVEILKNEVQALKSRCNMLENTVKDLKSICDTHEGWLETLRRETVKLLRDEGTLDLSLQGEELELMP